MQSILCFVYLALALLIFDFRFSLLLIFLMAFFPFLKFAYLRVANGVAVGSEKFIHSLESTLAHESMHKNCFESL